MRRESADPGQKRALAMQFMRLIRSMDQDALQSLILRHAGEDLARFFLAYANDLMEREPDRVADNASSLLLIGYLLRSMEEDLGRRTLPESPVLH